MPDTQENINLGGAWYFAYSLDAPATECATKHDAERAGLSFHDAQVPGNVELDLERIGHIPDPFQGMNIARLRDFELAHVWYGRRFTLPELHEGAVELVFEGIDCCATLFLNGEFLGETDNMLVEHVFDVRSRLRPENELFIHLRPPRLEAKRYDYPPSLGAHTINYDALHIRKAPHMYGWDIMPRALSAGLWRPIYLRFLPEERIETLHLETVRIDQAHQRADLSLKYRLHTQETPGSRYHLQMEGRCGESAFIETIELFSDFGAHRFSLEHPNLWWPNGYGEACLYTVRVSLVKDGVAIHTRSFDFGLRTVRLERTSLTDASGSGEFCFYVNDEKIFAKGSNWVPLDVFHARDLDRTDAVIDLAVAAHCNILRCWGGNVYESDRFFALCDAKGLMVWQDFAMACAVYPQDPEFQRRIAEEARKVVRRLRQHPSLVLWAGDNECDQAYQWFGLGDPNQNVLTRQTLPEVLRLEDPARPYLPSSPYIDEKAYPVGDRFLPENHLWGPRGYYKAEYYQSAFCHFASEIGYHGCPDPDSIRQFISADRVWPCEDNPEWNLHSTSPVPGLPLYGPENYRVELMKNQIRALFGEVPDSLEDFAFASQATQAEAKKTFIEMFRAGKWRRTGIIWWNLMDGWPQFSDAVVDYYFREKLAYHFITRSQQHLALIMQEPVESEHQLMAVNDTRQDIPLRFVITDVESSVELARGELVAPANQSTPVTCIPLAPNKQHCLLIEWESELGVARNHYLAGNPPFNMAKYRNWLSKAGLLRH